MTATVNSGGASTTVGFTYGETSSYGTSPTRLLVGGVAGNTVATGSASVSAELTGLKAKTLYYYKWTASNSQSGGTPTEATGTFTTDCFGDTAWSGVTGDVEDGEEMVTVSLGNVPGAISYLLSIWTGSAGGTTSDTLNRADTGVTGNSYTAWGPVAKSAATYGGKTAGGNSSIQINTTSGNGIWTTVSGGTAKKVTVDWNGNTTGTRSITVWGKDDAYTSTSGGTQIGTISYGGSAGEVSATLSADYPYIALRATGGAVYLNSVTIEWTTAGSPTYATGTVGGDSVTLHDVTVANGTEISDIAEGTYNWSLTAVGGSAGGDTCKKDGPTGTVTVTEAAAAATLTVEPSGTLTVPGTTYPNQGTAGSFTVAGENLTGAVTISAEGDTDAFEWKVGSGSWSSSLPSSQSFSPTATTIQARLKASTDGGTKTVTITFSGGGLADGVTKTVTGTVTAVAPTVGSPSSTSVTTTGATLGGTVTATGGAGLSEWGVVYSATTANTTPTVGGTGCTNLTASGTPSLAAFTRAVSGLSPNTEYKWRAYARNSVGYGYTAVQTFTTLRPTLTVSPTSVSDMAGVQYQDGTPVNLTVSGTNLMGNVTVAVTSGQFEVSTDGGSNWSTSESITASGTLGDTTVKVRIRSGSGTGPVSGTLTVSSSNAADVTVSLSGSVSEATVDSGYWLGNSQLLLNGTWYSGSGSGNPALPGSLGYLTELTLGGQVQTAGQQNGMLYPAYMTYSIDGGAETTVALEWFDYSNNNNWFGVGGSGQYAHDPTELDLSGLASGEHTLRVYFSQPTSVGDGTLYENYSATAVVYSITFVTPAWNGPNTVYWREQAVDGHFVRQDGDGNHDPWWYQITPTVGFHNPNMTDHGPNDIIFNNNIQLSMTNDAASTVNSITFTSSSSSSRTIRGSQTLTVNSSITNMGGTMNFRVPLAFGGDVTVTNSSSKSIYFYSAVNGNGHTLTKKGAGVLYIANAVTVGGATVAAGRLALNVGGSLSSDVSLTASSAVFSTYPQNAANVLDYAGVISGTGQVLKQGSGTTTLSGNNTYSGNTSVTNGTLIVGHANALGSGKSDVHVGLGTAKLKVGDGVTRVAAKSLNFIAADSELVTGAGKVVAVTNNAVIKKVSFDAGNYSGEDTQWAIVTSANGTITQSGDLTVVNPPATGACVLELSGDNRTLYVTYHKPPAAPSLTVATVAGNGGALSVTATPPAGAGVVVVRNESGTFGSPTGSTLPSVGATDWAGGTVVDVTGGTFTDSGLTGCTRYYYQAWSLKNGLWSTTGATGDAATDTVAAPVLNAIAAGTTTHNQFVVTWGAVAGVVKYRLDVYTGGGGSGSSTVSDTLTRDTTGVPSQVTGSYIDWDSVSVTSDAVYAGQTAGEHDSIQLRSKNNNSGIITTTSGGMARKVTLEWNSNTIAGRTVDIYGKHTAYTSPTELYTGSSGDLLGSIVCGTSTELEITTAAIGDYEYIGLRSNDGAVYLDSLEIEWKPAGAGAATLTYVSGYENKDVGNVTTYTVTGLSEQTTYHVKVRAEGATDACTSGDSNVEDVTTKQDTSLTNVEIANFDAAGESAGSNVAAGNVAAGRTVLVQGTKLTVAAGSVTPTLTGVTFTTKGTATGTDVTTYRVRVGTSSTYAGNETEKGTVTAGAAGSHTVTFGSSQSLTAGQTYYVWIEAVTAAGAAGGATVGVEALSGANFTTTGARKTGATTATGLQTIGNLTAFEAATGSTAGGQVALTWTAGAGGSVLVRWSDVSLAAIPDPATAWANEHTEASAGGYTVTGLTGCKTYYFKAWEVVGGTACGTARTDSADASSPAAPTGLGHGTPTAHEATLSWTAGTGAASHVIDLWHYEGGGGSETKTDEITIGLTGVTGTSYSDFDEKSCEGGSDAVYAGHVACNSSSYIQMNTTQSSWLGSTTSGGTLKSVTVDWNNASGHGYAVWGKTNGTFTSSSTTGATKIGDLDASTLTTGDISASGYVAVLILPSGGVSYANSITIEWEASGAGTKTDDIIAGAVQAGSTVVVTNGATSVGLGGLTDGTTYYWTVKALGYGDCAGGVSGQDSFATAELLGIPTINTPLTPGVGQLGGTVTGTAGATLILKRFESAELAGTGTAWGLSGTVVSASETTPGSGVWTFTDSGMDGCKTYWYKAWQWEDIDGERATSGASAVVSGKTQLGTPTVTATGAGTQMTLSWTAVPGATSYYVELASDNQFSRPTSGDPVLTEDFAEFSGTAEVTDLDSKTSTSGWGGNKVYAGAGSARLGTSSSAGYLTTPRITALSYGGTVYFDLKQWNSTEGASLTVQISYPEEEGEEETWYDLKTVTPEADFGGYSVSLPAEAKTSDFWICFQTSSKKRVYIDNVRVVPVGSGSSGSLKYEATVTGAPLERTADGLTVGQTYYYRVTTTGGDCETVTPIGSALTENAPIIQVTPLHYNFGTVTKNSGEHMADFVVRNTGNVALKFNAVTLVQDGDAYSFTAPAEAQRAADLAPGASRTYTVKFNPQTSGSRPATLRFGNDAYNTTGVAPVSGSETYANTDIPLSGICFDPATADPDVLWLSVEDGLGVENTVWDESMANSATQPVLAVIAYHYNGMAWDSAHTDWANWTLYDAEGVAVPGFSGKAFTAMTPTNYDGKSCSLFTAPITALGAAKTYRGTYKVGVTLKDSTRNYTTTTTEIVPIEQEWLLDDFMRADAVGSGGGALGNGWTARASSGSLPGSAAIRNASLELYGPGGLRSGTQGRVAAGRDMSDERYPKTWNEFTGSGSWGFHFRTGAKTVSWADGSTAGAFVLGATHVAWFTTEASQKGVAVMFTNDCVRLVRFEKSLLASGTITDLTTASYNGTQGKWLAVRVDYIPGQDAVDADGSDDGVAHDAVPAKMRLFVKAVEGPGGNPVEECGNADLVELVEVGDAVGGELKFAGPVWNHGTAQLSETTGGTFDDIYVPHLDGQGEPMEFRVIDEDVEGPEFYGFNIGGAIAAPDVASSGLTVTGMVHDASGLAGSVAFKVYNGETELYSGTATPAVVAGTTNMEYTVSCTIPSGRISGDIRSADCRFEVTATDGDDDRSEGGTNIDATAGTASYPFTFCASTPTAPAWATAEADGAEMVVLRWARSAGTTYVVVRSDEEIGDNSSPQGRTETMAEGTSVDGWGTVVYNGTGDNHLTGTWTAREFIVDPGSTNYFAVYGMTGDAGTGFYFSSPRKPNAYAWATTNESGVVTHHSATNSSGVPVQSAVTEGGWPCATPKYEPGEGVDSFEYRTSVAYPESELREGDTPASLSLAFNSEYASPRPETGSGWGGPWTGDVGTWKVHDGNLETWKTHFPTPVGNKLYWEDTSSSSAASATLYRPLAAENTAGKFFVAGMMNYGGGLDASMFDTAGTWMTIALVDDHDDVLVSFGKQGGGTLKDATLQVPVGQFGVTRNAVECRNTGSGGYYTLNPGHGQDYVIAGEVDRENKMIRMWVFYAGRTAEGGTDVQIPQVYDNPHGTITNTVATNAVQASWSWKDTAPDWAGKIAGIKLIAGSDNSHQLGHVYFDEIRFAQTWEELFLFNAPEVYTYDFDKPEEGTGRLDPVNPTDEDGHNQWQISDGALAHGDVGLNAQFGLFHRTGIQSASFTIKDAEGNQILKQVATTDDPETAEVDERLAPESGGTPGRVSLSGLSGAAYSDWKTPSGGATGTAVPTNRISLDETYTVEVTLTSAGGREAVVTAASETGGGGATDLFFGEYGEGKQWDKYVEIYNGTGHDIDLYNYYIFRPENEIITTNASTGVVTTNHDIYTTYSSLIPRNNGADKPPFARLYPRTNEFILHHKETVVLLNDVSDADHVARLAALEGALTTNGAHYIVMPKLVLDSSGRVPYLLVKAENFDEETVMAAALAGTKVSLDWVDACGCAQLVFTNTAERFIMSRKETATHLPRSKPLVIDPSEWEYRRWSFPKSGADAVDDKNGGYTNFVATAGQYDRNIGLGGNMEFKVYDDDTDAPALNAGSSGVKVGTGAHLTGTPGDRTYVMGGWSFTNWPSRDGAATNNLTLEEYKWITEMWPYGMTTRGGVSWSPLLGGDDLAGYVNVIEAGNNKGESNAEFDGITQRKYGCMVAHASSSFAKSDEVWLGFDLDTSKLSEAVLTFAYAGGSAGFANARVEVSTTGQEGTFTHPTGWEFTANDTGGAQVWTEWSGALADAGEAVAAAGHLWFRVVLKDYGTTAGTFRMDNIRLEGAPQFLRVSDEQMNTLDVVFDAVVVDTNSGLDTATATFTCGVEGAGLTPSQMLVSGGKSDSTFKWTKTGGFTKAKVQEWYTNSLAGKTQLRMSIADKDDDRPGDATTMTADFGTLDVYDDDDDPPTLEMATMKPRKDGTMAKWLLKEKTRTPSETMDGLHVGDLGLDTTAGTTSNPRYSLATNNSVKAYAVYQSGWQAGSKYWTATVKNTTAGAGTITAVRFWSKVGSVLAPTGYDIQSGTVAAGETEAASTTSKGTGSLLTSGSAWVKEGAEGATGSPIKTWAEYSTDVSIPLAAGETVEVRIFGTGADADGIGATWYLWGLEFVGTLAVPGEGGEDGYTYVTDNSLTGGGSTTLTMSGNVWDESGLTAAPTYSLTNAATGAEISSGSVSFTSEGEPAERTTKALGEFSQSITLSSMGYGVQLTEYKGGIHAEDADHDREDSSGNNTDKSVLDGQFAFTVIDQDLVGPTAPANVKVNGVDVPNETPDRLTVTWTNKPEFLVSFDVAHDQVPTETQLTSEETEHATWRAANGITNGMVKKASVQTGAAGVGEYRVALAGAGGAAPSVATMSNAPSFSVAVTNGALANYGFERYEDAPGVPDPSWANPDGDSGINKGDRINIGTAEKPEYIYPVVEGTNSYYLRGNGNGAIMSQVIPFEASVSDQTVTVDLKLKIYKRSGSSIAYAKFEFSEDGETWRSAASDVQLNTGADTENTWLDKEMATKALTANAGEKYLRFSLRMNGYTANIDDVWLSVRVGAAPAAGVADRATMRYVATGAAAQGLNAKYLFAADADNDRPQDRKLGAAVPFYTAYDITPPTAVAFKGHGNGASTDHVDDPTTQFDLTWYSHDIGPDDPDDDNYQSGWSGKNVLSPWGTYRVYYRAYDPIALEAAAADAGASSVETYLYKTLVCGPADGWNGSGVDTAFYKNASLGWKHVENGDEIEDVTAPATDGKRKYVGWDTITKDSNNQQSARLYDLDFDQEYVVVIVGVDKAGNEGPVTSTSWTTNNTIKFSLTRGWHMPKTDAVSALEGRVSDIGTRLTNDVVSALEWTAAGMTRNAESGRMEGEATKDYDLLQWDARSFRESPDNDWKLLQTVKTNWFVDDGGPTNRGSIRFYRASYKDRWKRAVTNTSGQVTAQTPLVSEEVYAQTAVPLRAGSKGQNFTALHGVPYTNTLRGVFGGTNEFPGDNGESHRTWITFYPPGETQIDRDSNDAVDVYWLNGEGVWRKKGDNTTDWSDIPLDTNLFTRAFSIDLPDDLGDYATGTHTIMHGTQEETFQYMLWKPILQVPTNGFERVIECGNAGQKKYNIVALRLPVAAHPSQMNLVTPVAGTTNTLGMIKGNPWDADEIYTIDPITKEPGHSCYCDLSGHWKFVSGGDVPWGYFKPNDILVIVSKNRQYNGATSWTWTYNPADFYTLPNRHMQAE